MNQKPKILLIGATGLVGEAVLKHAALAGRHISYLARRPADYGAGHDPIIAESGTWAEHIASLRPDILLSALGSTMKQAGSRDAFRAIDYEVQLAAARAAKAAGARHVICVSAVGASAKSRNFYLKTKGEVERDMAALDYVRVDYLRPGLLLGERHGPSRTGEGLATKFAPVVDRLMVGKLSQFRSVAGEDVARAMLHLASMGGAGHFVHNSVQIAALAD